MIRHSSSYVTRGFLDINSKNRIDPSQSSTYNFSWSITPNLECEYIGIQQIVSEVGFTNINSNDDTLSFTYNAVLFNVVLPIGDYDVFNLCTQISNVFTTAAGAPITFSVDAIGFVTLTITPGDTISINLTTNTDVWYMMGYYPNISLLTLGPAASTLIATSRSTRYYTKALYFCVNGLIEDASYIINGKLLEPVLGVWPMNFTTIGNIIQLQEFGEKVWRACRNIGTIKVIVRDDKGRIVDNNGNDLLITVYYI